MLRSLLRYFHLSFGRSLFQDLNKFSQQPCWFRVRELFEFDVLVHVSFVYFSKLHRAIIKAYSPRFDTSRAFLPSKAKELSISRFVNDSLIVSGSYTILFGQERISSRTFRRKEFAFTIDLLDFEISYTVYRRQRNYGYKFCASIERIERNERCACFLRLLATTTSNDSRRNVNINFFVSRYVR